VLLSCLPVKSGQSETVMEIGVLELERSYSSLLQVTCLTVDVSSVSLYIQLPCEFQEMLLKHYNTFFLYLMSFECVFISNYHNILRNKNNQYFLFICISELLISARCSHHQWLFNSSVLELCQNVFTYTKWLCIIEILSPGLGWSEV
jgi:hypothetical protein